MKLPRNSFISSPSIPVSFLLVLLLHAIAPGSEQRKSLVLKDRVPEKSLFHFEPDNSRREMWNDFMLIKDANSGDPVAQHELGLRYLMGKGFPADTQRAAYWITKAAEQNLMPARYNLAILLNNGISVAWNPFEAFRHFKFCAEHGMVEAQYVYGILLTDNLTVPKNYAEAYHWVKMAADSGYVPAQEVLAEFKQRGFDHLSDSSGSARRTDASKRGTSSAPGTPKPGSSTKPVLLDFVSETNPDSIPTPSHKDLLQEAMLDANAKLKEHFITLGIDSAEVQPDSASWREILQSAETGNPSALTLVGYRYATGYQVRQHIIAATTYYLRAIRYESSSASILLWKLAQTENFYSNLKKAVDAGNSAAQFSWAGLILFGFDHQLTEEQAIELLTRSAEQKYAPAIVELGIRFYTGASVNQDRAHALELFEEAAKRGSREALLRAAMVKLYSSKGISPDSVLLHVLEESAEEGSVLAEEILGYFYSAGIGVPRNIPESVKYYRRAAQRGSTVAFNALRGLYDGIRPPDAEFLMND